MAAETEQPTFTADDPTILRIKLIHDGIDAQPELYQETLGRLEAEQLDGQPRFIGPLTEAVAHAAAQIAEVLEERDDRYIIFDKTTDELLESDATYLGLVNEMKRHHSRSSRARNHKIIEDPEAVPSRDRVRYYRLRYYIGRVINWQEFNEKQSAGQTNQLRSAG